MKSGYHRLNGAHRVQFRDAFRGPGPPGEEDDASAAPRSCAVRAREIGATVSVNDVDHPVGELFPALSGVGTSLACFDGEACVQQQDTIFGPCRQVSVERRVSVKTVRAPVAARGFDKRSECLPVLGRLELRVLCLDFFVNLRAGSGESTWSIISGLMNLTLRKDGGTGTPRGTEKHSPGTSCATSIRRVMTEVMICLCLPWACPGP